MDMDEVLSDAHCGAPDCDGKSLLLAVEIASHPLNIAHNSPHVVRVMSHKSAQRLLRQSLCVCCVLDELNKHAVATYGP
eukprot:2832588-Amphidinium_carterae.1